MSEFDNAPVFELRVSKRKSQMSTQEKSKPEPMTLQEAGAIILNYAKRRAGELNIEPESAFNFLVASGDAKMHQMLAAYARIGDGERKHAAQFSKKEVRYEQAR